MKKCNTCGARKPLEQFFSNGYYKGKPKHKPNCRLCEMALVTRRYYGILEEHFGELACSICGYDRSVSALDCHHTDPSSKEYAIAKMRSYSKKKIVAELSKCVIVCANCHREIHGETGQE